MASESERIELSETELREITGYAASCTRRVLALFTAAVPDDLRPQDAIEAAEAFAAGERRSRLLRTTSWAAYRVAQEVADPAAAEVARSASHAAAAAYLHPLADPHQVKHVLGAAAHAARADELATSTTDVFDWVRRNAPTSVIAVLGRLPPAPDGGGRAGELIRDLDAALRG